MLIVTFAIAAPAAVGEAAAGTSGTVTASLTPNKPGKASKLTVAVKGPFSSSSGLPNAIALKVQKGFRSSIKSVSALCTAAQAGSGNCPAKSRVGTGNANATATFFGSTFHPTLILTLYLGPPQQHGDISSVVIVGKLENSPQGNGSTEHATGRLFHRSGGDLELLFSHLPSFSAPPGVTVSLDSLDLKAGATRIIHKGHGKHRRKVTYALITNPASCANGRWTGSFEMTFSSGTVSRPLIAACRG